MRFIKLNLLCALFLQHSNSFGQQPKSYSHVFIAEIKRIDTIILTKGSYGKESYLPIPKTLYIEFKRLDKLEGSFKGIRNFILVELSTSDHHCENVLLVGKRYKIYTKDIRYTSRSIKKKFRKSVLTIDCFNTPLQL
jgi:hypothetical protein